MITYRFQVFRSILPWKT